MTEDRAVALAEAVLRDIETRTMEPIAVQNVKRVLETDSWLIYWNSRSYLKNGDPKDMLAGNGPILVRSEGSVVVLESGSTVESQLKSLGYEY